MGHRCRVFLKPTAVSAAALAVAISGGAAVAQTVAADPFLVLHQEGVSANKLSDAYSIRFKAGRSVFQMREPIEIELVFKEPRWSPSDMRMAGLLILAHPDPPYLEVIFDRHDISNPLRAIDRRFDDSWNGGWASERVAAPRVFTRRLNEAIRFDAPGQYRLFVRSRYITRDEGPGDPETSNVLSFHILERDPSWEAASAARAARILENPGSRREASAAISELRVLGTTQAAVLLARELWRDHDRPNDVILQGLFTVDDRAFVVRALERELQEPDRTLLPEFVRDLAMLELSRRHPAGPPYSHAEYLDTIRDYSARRARAFDRQPGRLQAEIARELGDHQSDVRDEPWRRSGYYFLTGVLAPAMYQSPAETTAAFLTLSSGQQSGLLIASWRRFAHAGFVPLLRTLYASSKDQVVRGAALRRLAELAPIEGRTAILAELRRPVPRVGTDVLLHLPDGTLPALERIWVGQLEHATADEGRTSAAQRIQRYGTPWSGRRVAQFYSRHRSTLPSTAKAAILAHLSRVNPAVATRGLREASSLWPTEGDRETLLDYVAQLTWQPEIERAAIEALSASNRNDVESAARLLSRHGTPAAGEHIRARLSLLRAALLRQKAERPASFPDELVAGYLENDLAVALAHARGWLLADDTAAAEAAQCVTSNCSWAFLIDRRADPAVEVEAYGPIPGDERHVSFRIGQMDYDSIEALERKLTQFASGTRVFWNDWPRRRSEDNLERWTWSERDALFEQVRSSAARHGVRIQRERTWTWR